MRGFFPLLVLSLLFPACTDDSGPSEPPVEFGGTYIVRYTLTNAALEMSCWAKGTSNIVQSGSTFGGTFNQTGECMSPYGGADISGMGVITRGSVRGNHVSFEVEECAFEGTAVGSPPNGGSGDVTCSFDIDGMTLELEGDWVVTRGAAALVVSPDSAGVPLDGSLQFTASVFGPGGEPLQGRQVTWESNDPSIATVDASGTVTGISPGEVLIKAISVPVYPLEEAIVVEAHVSVVLRFVSIEAGDEHTCGVAVGGRAFCWGRASDGRLGIGPAEFVETLPRAVAYDPIFESVTPGMLHTCAVGAFGVGLCWGSNLGGALGRPGGDSDVPVPIDGQHQFAALNAGSYGTCGTVIGGEAFCWGSNDDGQLGIGAIGGPYQFSPVPVGGGTMLHGVSMTVSAGGGGIHVCGIGFSGAALCWGQGTLGELGNGETEYSGTPQTALSGVAFESISSGWGHTCAIATGGDAYCWGYQISGALGTGVTEPAVQPTPVPVSGGLKFESISAGDHFTCAVADGGDAYCWGWGGSNQLGNGQPVDRLEPTAVAGGLKFTSVTTGSGFACGVATDGFAYCWGANGSGQLGTGDQQGRATPTRVGLQ